MGLFGRDEDRHGRNEPAGAAIDIYPVIRSNSDGMHRSSQQPAAAKKEEYLLFKLPPLAPQSPSSRSTSDGIRRRGESSFHDRCDPTRSRPPNFDRLYSASSAGAGAQRSGQPCSFRAASCPLRSKLGCCCICLSRPEAKPRSSPTPMPGAGLGLAPRIRHQMGLQLQKRSLSYAANGSDRRGGAGGRRSLPPSWPIGAAQLRRASRLSPASRRLGSSARSSSSSERAESRARRRNKVINICCCCPVAAARIALRFASGTCCRLVDGRWPISTWSSHRSIVAPRSVPPLQDD